MSGQKARDHFAGVFSRMVRYGVMGIVIFSLVSYKSFNWKESLVLAVFAGFIFFYHNRAAGPGTDGELFLLFLAFIYMTSKFSDSRPFFYALVAIFIGWIITSMLRGSFELLRSPLDASILITAGFLFFVPAILNSLTGNNTVFNEPMLFSYQRKILLFIVAYFVISKSFQDHMSRRLLEKIMFLCLFVFISVGIIRVMGSLYYFGRAAKYDRLKRFDIAQEGYKKAVDLNPLFLRARLCLARVYSRQGYWGKAQAQYEWLDRHVFASKSPIHLLLAEVYERHGDLNKAIRTYEQIGRNSPEYNNAAKELMRLYVVNMDRERLKKILKDQPDNALLSLRNAYDYDSVGNLYYEIGYYKEALAYFSKAIELDPSKKTPYFNKGMSYKGLGQSDRAIEAFMTGLAYNTANLAALDQLYQLYSSKGETAKAEALLIRMKSIMESMQAAEVFVGLDKKPLKVRYLKKYEAEHLGIAMGKVEPDENASDKHAVHARSAENTMKDFIFGPGEALPPGFYTAFFGVKLGRKPGDKAIFSLDVYSHEPMGFNHFLARRVYSFPGPDIPDRYYDVAVAFYNPGGADLEFRICLANGEIWADRILVVPDISIDKME